MIIDNFLRRRLVAKIGSNSLIPIASLRERIKYFSNTFGQKNLDFLKMDITKDKLRQLIREKKPKTIYHLAQQPSAHYSMKSVSESIFTVQNNEIGNLELLWAIKNHSPETHLIKLGSFGEYAECGLDIAEGYFLPEYKGKRAKYLTPFPREADDVYHISKINDTNFIAMACRKWNLRITDIMQSTIFGNQIREFGNHHRLYTRFDYDEYFGTVINRFLVQSILSIPISIYGSGHQRNGLMSLEDAASSLTNLFELTPEKGEHRVINHVIEKSYSINELAYFIKKKYEDITGKQVRISQGEFDPRNEQLDRKKEYQIETSQIQQTLDAQPIEKTIEKTIHILSQYQNRIIRDVINPSFQWGTSFGAIFR